MNQKKREFNYLKIEVAVNANNMEKNNVGITEIFHIREKPHQ